MNTSAEAKNFLMSKPGAAINALKRINVGSIREVQVYWDICRDNPRVGKIIRAVAQKENFA